jgi:hypothetical protein
MTRHAVRRAGLALAGFAALSVLYFFLFWRLERTSDQASILLAGLDMLHGNWRLSGWWLSIDNFYTMEAWFYTVLIGLFGFQPMLMFVLAAMIWAGIAVLSALVATRRVASPMMASCIALTLIGLPIMASDQLMPTLSQVPIHTTTTAYVLICFLLLDNAVQAPRGRGVASLVAYTILMTVTVFGDPMAGFVAVLPVIAVSLLRMMRRHRGAGPHGSIAALSALSAVLAAALLWLNEHTGGFRVAPQPTVFVTLADLPDHFGFAMQSLLIYFSADFFGRSIRADAINGPILYLLRAPLFLLLLGMLAAYLRHVWRIGHGALTGTPATPAEAPPRDYLDELLASSCIIAIAAAMFSSLAVPDKLATGRYYIPAFVFGATLVARIHFTSRVFRAYCGVTLLASAAVTALILVRTPPTPDLAGPDVHDVAAWLDTHDLHDGFGPYWMSSIVTVVTQGMVRVRPLDQDQPGALKPFPWLSSQDWYKDGLAPKGHHFVIVHDVPTRDYFTEADVIGMLGLPQDQQRIGDYVVNIYE